MSYYGDNSDLKRAGRNIVTVEIIFPILLIVVSGAYALSWKLVLKNPLPDVFDLQDSDHLMILICLVLIYGLLDLVLGVFLCVGVTKLNSAMCLSWTFCQLILLNTLVCAVFLFPYFAISLAYMFWELICCFVILTFYKLYRIYVVHFLRLEIRREGIVWKERPIYE